MESRGGQTAMTEADSLRRPPHFFENSEGCVVCCPHRLAAASNLLLLLNYTTPDHRGQLA